MVDFVIILLQWGYIFSLSNKIIIICEIKMQFTKLFVLAALFAVTDINAISVQTADFNGADEDEIMDKVFSKYSTEGKDHNGVKNGQKILMKSTAPKAAGVILEATHKLKSAQVPGYMKANFEKAWDRFDIN
jgi:hypothetical protein